MAEVGECHLRGSQMDCIIAAILTIASAGSDTFQAKSIVDRYSKVLEQLRSAGGHKQPVVERRSL
jgi:hypothetical protein